jgi:predicted nucleic acid-binding protein
MLLLCLDTSSLERARLESAKLRELLAEASRLSVVVCVTEIVLDELPRISADKIREKYEAVREGAAEIGRRLGRESLHVEEIELGQDLETRLRDTHRQRFADFDVVVVPTVPMDLPTLLEQSHRISRPSPRGTRGCAMS